MARYDMQTVTLGTLLDDPEAVAIIDRILPGASSHPMASLVRGMKAVDALRAAAGRVAEPDQQALVQQLEAL